MGYRTLKHCLQDLEAKNLLVRIDHEIDPDIEMGVIQRKVFQNNGPALLFTRAKGTEFPMVGNLFGSMERMEFIFRDTIAAVERIMALKADPRALLKNPFRSLGALSGLVHTAPKKVATGPVLAKETSVSRLPQLKSWPLDGGAYVTLPQVYSEDVDRPGFAASNLGMYRIQLSGNEYSDREIGLHYQIHRGIGSHHAKALERGVPFRVNVFVGGPPAMTLAAVMPLPEGFPELHFAGLMAGHRIPMICGRGPLPFPAEADFCITGTVSPDRVLPEGPFGDHLGYYSLKHDFPVLNVERVYHREGAIWPFTTVGRPPQEDTMFGQFIHRLVHPLVPTVYYGVHQVHAVDAAGVHPLLLAVGSERYVPFAEERIPQELLTCAMSLLGTTQTALSKYLCIVAREDDPGLSAHDIPGFFRHLLERIDPERDLHFITRTTMDTLDYSGISLNQGSKVIMAAAGRPRRTLGTTLPSGLSLPERFADPTVFAPGIMLIKGPKHSLPRDEQDPAMEKLCLKLENGPDCTGFPLVVVVDDPLFTARDWNTFLWVAFTRSDPATDLYGVGSFTRCKHWGCKTPMVMDGRLKSHHPLPLEPDPDVERRVRELAAPNGPLHGLF
ncbi:MAG: UbiD family decarboxylase [Desulfovibrionales bacterium]